MLYNQSVMKENMCLILKPIHRYSFFLFFLLKLHLRVAPWSSSAIWGNFGLVTIIRIRILQHYGRLNIRVYYFITNNTCS